MQKVIPKAINYSDIKPEAIENMVRLVRFTPTATINNAKANDIVRFQLLGNGFFDPYSAYIRIEVEMEMTDLDGSSTAAAGNEFAGRFLDRSAHSLIGRLVIKSQGTELERIEQYDVAAAMVNDMLYSQEQSVLHSYEGFPTKQADLGGPMLLAGYNPYQLPNGSASVNYVASDPTVRPAAALFANCSNVPLYFLGTLTQDLNMRYLIDQGFWSYAVPAGGLLPRELLFATTYVALQPGTGANVNADSPVHLTYAQTLANAEQLPAAAGARVKSENRLVFCIPIYSGVIGVMMPDKKMLPMSLMPLEVEFTLNPYAFYDVGVAATILNPRNYTVTKFWIYSHVLSFEQELHRSLEAVVAENGIFIHFNSFYLAPIATHVNQTLLQYAQINIHAKSINSVHFVFIYTGFEQPAGARKLHFVNHNLGQLQIRNGTELMPSEAIQGDQQTRKSGGEHVQFMLETFKAYNKMHDPTTDAALSAFSYCFDNSIARPVNFATMITQQAQLGRCQYAISLEGEELGQDKTIITGRKGLIPFDITMGSGQKSVNVTSFQFIFVRADYIIYVRPDLVVTLLGR